VAVVGHDFRFAFRVDGLEKQKGALYATIVLRRYPAPTRMGGSCITHDLQRMSSGEYAGYFVVPDSVASFWIRLSDSISYVGDISSPEYLVCREDHEYVQGVNLLTLTYASLDEYEVKLELEKKHYSTNYESYAFKWMYQLSKGAINFNVVKEELNEVQQKCSNRAIVDALSLIGNSILENQNNRKKYAKNLTAYTDSPVFNTEYVPLLLKALTPYKEELAVIHSVASWLSLLHGDYMRLDWDMMRSMLGTRIAERDEIINHYYFGRLLLERFPDSAKHARKSLEYVLDVLHSGSIIHYDPGHELQTQIPNIYIHLGHACNEMGEFDEAIHFLEKGLETVDNTDVRAGFMYLHCAESYKGIEKYKEAMQQYLNAKSVLPKYFQNEVTDSLSTLDRMSASSLDYDEVMRLHTQPSSKLNKALLSFTTDNKGDEQIDEASSLAVIEFWSTSCSFCDKNVNEMVDYFRLHPQRQDDLLVYLIPNIPPDELRSYFRYPFPGNIRVVYDGDRIAQECLIESYPVTLVTNRGRQVARIDGSYGDVGFDGLVEKFFDEGSK
jgi:tetratricopeptide (TPR) repeat protein